MDADFADFLLDESHLDLNQKRIDDADFLEGLKISDDDEETFFLTVDFDSEEKLKPEETFDVPFEITSEDLALLEAQEIQINTNNLEKHSTPRKSSNTRRFSIIENKENSSPARAQETDKLKADLDFHRSKAESTAQELAAQKRQILTKEGEITILRQRLVQLDNEKIIMAQKYSELTECNRKTIDKLEDKWKKEVDNLKTDLLFKEQELRSISTSQRRKIPKNSFISIDQAPKSPLGEITDKKLSPSTNIKATSQEFLEPLDLLDDLDLFSSFIQKLDLTWKFSELRDFDTLDIVRARESACDEIKRIFSQSEEDRKSGKALAHCIVKLFDRSLHLRQPVLLAYTSQLCAQIFDTSGNRIQNHIFEIKDSDNQVKIFKQICSLLTEKVILGGIPKEIIISQFIIINVIIYQLEMKIPEEFKKIVSCGVFQWILRSDIFTGDEMAIIGTTLYSFSCDLNMLSAVFLSSESDKVECNSVLDILLSLSEKLVDSLFPRGKVYRCRFGNQLPLLDDELDRLKKANVVLSLLFSFVHRSLGPVTLWMPDHLILAQVVWAIDVFGHDIKTPETSDYLDPYVLIAQEDLLDTIFLGLSAAWVCKDIEMPSILMETRIPLFYVVDEIAKHTTSFGGASKSAGILAKIIDEELSIDIKCVQETGSLPRRNA